MYHRALIFTVVFGLLLLGVNRLPRHERKYLAALGGIALLGLAWISLIATFLFGYSLIWVNTGLLVLAAIACGFRIRLPKPILIGTLLVIVVSYGGVAWKTLLMIKALEREYPIESLESRLAYENEQPPSIRLAGAQSQPSSPLVTDLEEKIPFRSRYRGNRPEMLRQLHENTLEAFVNSRGFGFGRGVPHLEYDVRIDEIRAVPQPKPAYDPSTASADNRADLPPDATQADMAKRLQSFHSDTVVDFINPKGFGYVKERRTAAGFQEHRISSIHDYGLDPNKIWRVQRVELVSLLKYSQPGVYLTDNLPRMDELRTAKVRPLDDFEKRQLPALFKGEDLVLDQTDNTVRVLGAIRAAKQCLNCHEVSRGDLLGAFSYRLGKATK